MNNWSISISVVAIAALLAMVIYFGHSCEMETRRMRAECLAAGRTAVDCQVIERAYR